MPSIIDPHPDWIGLLAQRIKAAAQSPQRWLALLSWLIKLALARLAAFAGDVRALQLDKAFQRDLRAMVRFAEGMLRLAIRDAAREIAFYRVHPNEALPSRLRDHLAGLRLRPLRPPRPPHLPHLQPPPPRPPGFRVTLPFPGASRSGELRTQRLNLSGNAEALGPGSRPVRARPGGDAAREIAFYRVHPNEALPSRLRDHLAGLRLRPLRAPRPPHLPQLQPPPPRPPGFRVTLPAPSSHRRAASGGIQKPSTPRALDPADAARSGMTQQEGAPQHPSSHRREASGGIQKGSAPRALDPADAARSGMTQLEGAPQTPSSHRRAASGGIQKPSAPRALDPADAARSGMTQQEGAHQTPSSHRRAAIGGIQKPSVPPSLDPADAPRSGMTQQMGAHQSPSSHRRAASGGIQQPSATKARAKRRRAAPSSPASLLWRLLALQKAMPKLEKYAWRLAKAEARRDLLPPRARKAVAGFPAEPPALTPGGFRAPQTAPLKGTARRSSG